MICTINGINISQRLSKTIYDVAKHSEREAIIIASFMNNDLFRQFVNDNINHETDVMKDKTFDVSGTNIEDYQSIKQPTLRRLIKEYLANEYKSVNRTAINPTNNLMGFSSVQANLDSRKYVGKLIKDAVSVQLESTNPITGDRFIQKISESIVVEYRDRISQLYELYSTSNLDVSKEFGDKLTDIANKWNSREQMIADKVPNSEIKKFTRGIVADMLNLAEHFGELDGVVKSRLSEFSNLVRNVMYNRNDFFGYVYKQKELTNIAKDFVPKDDIIQSIEDIDNIDDNEINEDFGFDQMSKSWENSMYKDTNDTVSREIRLLISRIPVLNSPYTKESTIPDYNLDNTIGVMEYSDYEYIMNKIYTEGVYNNEEDFLDSLRRLSERDEKFYGIGLLVEQLENNPLLLNKMYAAFAKPIIPKTMVKVINLLGEQNINFDISNKHINPVIYLTHSMVSRISNNYKRMYNYEHHEIITNEFNNAAKNIEPNIEKIIPIIKSLFPNISEKAIYNFINNKDKGFYDKYNKEIKVADVRQGKVVNSRTEIHNDYYDKSVLLSIVNNIYDELEKLNGINVTNTEIINSTLYQNIYKLATLIVETNSDTIKLTTTNGKGTQASDIGKNSWVTRTTQQIKAETNDDLAAGVKSFGQYITQGEDNGRKNSYHYNPLFFGLRDITGVIIVNNKQPLFSGMFTREQGGLTINDRAKDIINISIFDGVRNNQTNEGAVYSGMQQIDFFISQLVAYTNSYKTFQGENTNEDSIHGSQTAVYPMRIGSDAPKIFNIRAPRFTVDKLHHAFTGHVLNKYSQIVNALYALTEERNGRFYFKEDTDNLYNTYHFDKTIFDENGKLTGNVFRHDRLHTVNGYNANAELDHILSLYGEAGIIKQDDNGKRYLDVTAENSPIGVGRNDNGEATHFDFNRNAEINNAITEIVLQWMDNYKQDIVSRTNEMRQFAVSIGFDYSDATVIDYVLNATNINMCYDDLYEGDYAFYGSARKSLKRAKETQAGGESFSGVDILDTSNDVKEKLFRGKEQTIGFYGKDGLESLHKDGSVHQVPTYVQGHIITKPMTARTGFRAVTIHNTNTKIDGVENMYKLLYDGYIKDGYSKEVANELAGKMAAAYGYDRIVKQEDGSDKTVSGSKTKVNDAQSYITLDEFIRRCYADGSLNQYKDLIRELLDPNVTINQLDMMKINQIIQVRKNFYYDKIYDDKTGTYVPRQIKNSEFVIIPKLLPANSDLIKLHDWMVKNDIGQVNTVETSKAATRNVMTIWDNDGIMTKDFLDNFETPINETYTENYQYKYLYKQLDVAQHMSDAKNKMGAQISKKIMDNILYESEKHGNVNESLKKVLTEYQDAYSENIKESFNDLCSECGFVYNDETGTITDTNGNDVDFTYFYKRCQEEIIRLGGDENLLDFFDSNDGVNTKMPNWMANNNKTESIFAAIFNRRITRQTMPGWHGVQLTDVGYSDKLNFDPKTGVMQIRLPRWSKLLPKDMSEKDLLEAINEGGLDIHLGYRMPTEGKQSVSVLKVIGFVPEYLGSTIVVPYGWVTQTGSDFDVDSIYGISFEIERTYENGKLVLKKVPYTEDTIDNKYLYKKYVNKLIKGGVQNVTANDEIDEINSRFREEIRRDKELLAIEKQERDNKYKELDEIRNDIWQQLPNKDKAAIVKINKSAKPIIRNNKAVANLPEIYNKVINYINSVNTNDISPEQQAIYNNYVRVLSDLHDIIENGQNSRKIDYSSYNEARGEEIRQAIAKVEEENFNHHEKLAVEAGGLSFDEWSKLPLIKRLDRRARNNYILDRMITIMNDSSSREEQYGRSHFEDVIGDNGKVDNLKYGKEGKQTISESVYNPLDQLKFFDDAMSGARLKSYSVNQDVFASRMNVMRGRLSAASYPVVIKNASSRYNIESIKESYGDDVVQQDDTLILNLSMIGHSRTNKNIVDKIITSYTSQTSAHAFDAVKEGSIENVNDYTFNVYKFFSIMGLDHYHAIAYIRQPGISNLVTTYNNSKSIYAQNNAHILTDAIKNAIANAGIVKKKGSGLHNQNSFWETALGDFLSHRDVAPIIKDIMGKDYTVNAKDFLQYKFPIDIQSIEDNYKNRNTNTPIENAIHDIITLVQFNSIQKITDSMNGIMMSLNIDKQGSRQTLSETKRAIENIENIRKKPLEDQTIIVKGKGIMDAVFPVNDKGIIQENESVYKSTATTYKYATVISRDLGIKLFPTETPAFDDVRDTFEKSYIHKRLTSEQQKQVTQYITQLAYTSIDRLTQPVRLNKSMQVITNTQSQNQANTDLLIGKHWNDEITRVLGYNMQEDVEFVVGNVNDYVGNTYLTEEQLAKLDEYYQLTPAQKVLFIQEAFKDDAGLFANLNVTLYNPYEIKRNGYSRQYISYQDSGQNLADMIQQFENAFTNNNIFVKLAAIDLIKYAFLAEGYQYRTGYIRKIVPNSILIENTENGGFDIIDNNNGLRREIEYLPAKMLFDGGMSKVVRANSELCNSYIVPGKVITSEDEFGREAFEITNMQTYIAHQVSYNKNGIIFIGVDSLGKQLIDKLSLFDNEGGYINVTHNITKKYSEQRLYKVIGRGEILDDKDNITAYNRYYLVPINKLHKHETVDYSYDNKLNKFAPEEVLTHYVNNIDLRIEHNEIGNNKTAIVKEIKSGEIVPVNDSLPVEGRVIDSDTTMADIANNDKGILADGVRRLTSGIATSFVDTEIGTNNHTYYQFNPNSQLGNLLKKGHQTEQVINVNGVDRRFKITSVARKEFGAHINSYIKNNKQAPAALQEVVDELIKTKIDAQHATIYKVTEIPMNSDEVITRQSTTGLLGGISNILPSTGRQVQTVTEITNIDRPTQALISHINFIALKQGTVPAVRFNREIKRANVIVHDSQSVVDNIETIMSSAASYYCSVAHELNKSANNIDLGDGIIYKINDKALYERLIEDDSKVDKVINMILDGLTFGRRVEDIFNIDTTGNDVLTKEITSINNSINSVRNNIMYKQALDYFYEIYMARFSNNPAIYNGIMRVRESFGDMTKIDELFGDPRTIKSPQVQLTIKKIEESIEEAKMFTTKRNVERYRSERKAIDERARQRGETINEDNIIDKEDWRFKQEYNDNWLIDFADVSNKVYELSKNKYRSTDDFKAWFIANTELEKFKANTTHQEYIDDYYKEKVANSESLIRANNDSVFEYFRLRGEYFSLPEDGSLSQQQIDYKQSLKDKMLDLASDNVGGVFKPAEHMAVAKIINDYLKRDRTINDKYTEFVIDESIYGEYENYRQFIERYDKKHTDMTISEKLQDENYREAYDWIKRHIRENVSAEFNKKFNDAFKTLTGRTNGMNPRLLKKARNIKGAVDENGVLDPRKLSDTLVEQMRAAEMSDAARQFEDDFTESVLIKAVTSPQPFMKRDSNELENKEEYVWGNKTKRDEIVTKLNKHLINIIDTATGELNLDMAMDDSVLSDIDVETINNLWQELSSISGRRNKLDSKLTKNKMWEETIDDSFEKHKIYYDSLTDPKKKKRFEMLFMAKDRKGNWIANRYLYMKRNPTVEFIDTKRNEARKFIEDNVEYVTTIYYEKARIEARQKGEQYYAEWYYKNHIYDVYSHKYKPLRMWTTMQPKVGSEYANSIEYIPKNSIRKPKEFAINNEHKQFGNNYKRGVSKYDSNIKLNQSEREYKQLLEDTLAEHVNDEKGSYSDRKFVGEGWLPRSRKAKDGAKHHLEQIASLAGFSYKSNTTSDTFSEKRDYVNSKDVSNSMLAHLKGKGTVSIPKRPVQFNGESTASYQQRLAKWQKEVDEIKKNNLAIDSNLIDRNIDETMEKFIHNATINESTERVKPFANLLLEDLDRHNKHYKTKGIWDERVVTSSLNGTINQPIMNRSERMYDVLHNYFRRVFYQEFNENSSLRNVANFAQNFSSAKFMMFNLLGGINNIAVGETNIGMEFWAQEFFDKDDYGKANIEYGLAIPHIFADMYSETSSNLTVSLLKYFDVVDYDKVFQNANDNNNMANNAYERIRSWSYGFQSSGEHMMQNKVLLAMLMSNRLYTGRDGKQVLGSFADYRRDVEQKAMQDVIKRDKSLQSLYKIYINDIKSDINKRIGVVQGKDDINVGFLKYIKNNIGNEEFVKLSKDYQEHRKTLLANAKKEFYSDNHPTLYSLYENVDGVAKLKIPNTPELDKLLAGFKTKVLEVNRHIHGVYDKYGAAKIEKEWYGSILMQYKKHIWNGFRKRIMRGGYFNELSGTRKRGAYMDAIDFLTTEFDSSTWEGLNAKTLQNIMISLKNTATNLTLNWNNLSEEQRANILRIQGEAVAMLLCITAIALAYGLTDDDDIKDSKALASMIYLADRLSGEIVMHTPTGAYTEYQNFSQNQVAAWRQVQDANKLILLVRDMIIDPNYQSEFDKGVNKGRNKFTKILQDNFAPTRQYYKIKNITKNNEYYKIDKSNYAIILGKAIGSDIDDYR